MKNDSIFEHEQTLLLRANELLDQNSASISSENYEELISEYKRLLKTTSRLVRHNDRNEQRLNDLAKEANEKRQQLEGLSKQLSKYLSPQVYQSIFSGEKAVSVASTRKKQPTAHNIAPPWCRGRPAGLWVRVCVTVFSVLCGVWQMLR